eukprot:4829317-Alexandrium_andersonii.AAC.1
MEAASSAGCSSSNSRPRARRRRPSRRTKLGWSGGKSGATSAGRARGIGGGREARAGSEGCRA